MEIGTKAHSWALQLAINLPCGRLNNACAPPSPTNSCRLEDLSGWPVQLLCSLYKCHRGCQQALGISNKHHSPPCFHESLHGALPGNPTWGPGSGIITGQSPRLKPIDRPKTASAAQRGLLKMQCLTGKLTRASTALLTSRPLWSAGQTTDSISEVLEPLRKSCPWVCVSLLSSGDKLCCPATL